MILQANGLPAPPAWAPPAKPRIIRPPAPTIVPASRIPNRFQRSIWERWVEQERWQAAVGCTALTVANNQSGTTGTGIAFTPVSGRYYIIAVESKSTAGTNRVIPTLAGHSSFSAWTQLTEISYSTIASPTRNQTLFGAYCDQAPASASVVATFSQTQTVIIVKPYELTGMATSSPIQQTLTPVRDNGNTAMTGTFGAATNAANAVLAFFTFASDTSTLTFTSPLVRVGVVTRSGNSGTTSVDAGFIAGACDTPAATDSTGAAYALCAVEIKVASSQAISDVSFNKLGRGLESGLGRGLH